MPLVMSKTSRCEGCGNRCRAYRLCRTCKSKCFHARKQIEARGLIVDQAGGGWWIWDAKGEVLVIGRDTRIAALLALAYDIGLDVDSGTEISA